MTQEIPITTRSLDPDCTYDVLFVVEGESTEICVSVEAESAEAAVKAARKRVDVPDEMLSLDRSWASRHGLSFD